MGQNISGDLGEIWFTSVRLLDNQAPKRAQQAWQGGIFTCPHLSRLVPRMLFLSTEYNTASYLTNRFRVAVHLSSNRSQMTSKCGKDKKLNLAIMGSGRVIFSSVKL